MMPMVAIIPDIYDKHNTAKVLYVLVWIVTSAISSTADLSSLIISVILRLGFST